jgi:hypothetical protein
MIINYLSILGNVFCNKRGLVHVEQHSGVSCNHLCRGKVMSITYSERVFVCVALVMQDATRMRRILSFLASLALPYFSTLSHKRRDSGKKLLNIKCVFFYFHYNLVPKHFLL